MRQLALTFLTAFALLACGLAQAAPPTPVCSATATSVSGTYTSTAALNQTGNISVNCSRNGGSKNQTLYIGINNGVNGTRNLKRQTGSDLLPYTISKSTGFWTEGVGGLLVAIDFQVSDPLTLNIPYYFQVAMNYIKPPGTYDDNPVTVTVHLGSDTGTLLTTTSFVPQATINPSCSLSSPPGTLTLNYTSFSPLPVNNSITFDATCTLTTPYTLSLDATSGTLSGINYTLALSSAASSGTGLAQTYSITGTAAAGQSGICAGAMCSTSEQRTLTITY